MSWLFPRGTRRLPPIWVDDVPESVKVEGFDMLIKEMLSRPLEYVGGYKMGSESNEKMQLVRCLQMQHDMERIQEQARMERREEELRKELNTLGFISPVERKRQLMRLEKEWLVDMVFNLESRNETLVNNLLEVEKMYAKLKEEK